MNTETTETVPKTKYTPIKNPTIRHIAAKTLLEHSNLSQSEIGRQLNYSTTYVKELKKKLSKTSIVSPKLLRLAKIRLKEILEREPAKIEKITKEGAVVELKDYPSHANVLEAINTVVSRSEPIAQKVDMNMNIDLGERLERAMARHKSEKGGVVNG